MLLYLAAEILVHARNQNWVKVCVLGYHLCFQVFRLFACCLNLEEIELSCWYLIDQKGNTYNGKMFLNRKLDGMDG